jgi:hypothetical protein
LASQQTKKALPGAGNDTSTFWNVRMRSQQTKKALPGAGNDTSTFWNVRMRSQQTKKALPGAECVAGLDNPKGNTYDKIER